MLESLKRAGKIRYYGVSCDSADAAGAALLHQTVSSLQLPLNLLDRDALNVLPQAQKRGVGVIARECLANGLLVKDASTFDLRVYTQSASEAASKAARLDAYRQAAADQGCTLTQLALQFVNQMPGVSVSLVGVSSLTQLRALLSNGLPLSSRPDASAPHPGPTSLR